MTENGSSPDSSRASSLDIKSTLYVINVPKNRFSLPSFSLQCVALLFSMISEGSDKSACPGFVAANLSMEVSNGKYRPEMKGRIDHHIITNLANRSNQDD